MILFVSIVGVPHLFAATPVAREAIRGFVWNSNLGFTAEQKVSNENVANIATWDEALVPDKAFSKMSLWSERDLTQALAPKHVEVDLRDFIHFDVEGVSDSKVFEGLHWNSGDVLWRLRGATLSMRYEPRSRPTWYIAPYALIDAMVFEPVNEILSQY